LAVLWQISPSQPGRGAGWEYALTCETAMLIQYAAHVSTSDISPLTIPSIYPTSAAAFHLIEMMMMMMMLVVVVVMTTAQVNQSGQ